MATSINEDVVVGNVKFHVQTEFYRSSNKIVSNIFRNGAILKKLEREVEFNDNIDDEIKNFHSEVVNKLLTMKGKTIKSKDKLKISLSDEKIEKLIEIISPYYGVASFLILDDALSSASSVGDFVRNLLDGITDEEKEELNKKIKEILISEMEEVKKTSEIANNFKNEILSLLNSYFGVMALSVFEEALEKTRDKSFSEFIEEVTSQLDEKEAKELREKLNSLYT